MKYIYKSLTMKTIIILLLMFNVGCDYGCDKPSKNSTIVREYIATSYGSCINKINSKDSPKKIKKQISICVCLSEETDLTINQAKHYCQLAVQHGKYK